MYKHTSDAAANRKMNIYIYPILRYHTNDNIILAFNTYGSPGCALRLPFCLGRPLHLIQLQSIIQIEIHSFLLKESGSLNPIGHCILPFAASVEVLHIPVRRTSSDRPNWTASYHWKSSLQDCSMWKRTVPGRFRIQKGSTAFHFQWAAPSEHSPYVALTSLYNVSKLDSSCPCMVPLLSSIHPSISDINPHLNYLKNSKTSVTNRLPRIRQQRRPGSSRVLSVVGRGGYITIHECLFNINMDIKEARWRTM